MEIFNIGPLELIGILLIMFFLLGPKGMILTAQKIGAWIRKLVKSPVWKEIMGYSQDIRELPKKIMDDTGLKEALDDVQKTTKDTAAELNATVNEAVQSARVPEAEHVRIDTTPATGTDNRKTYPVAEPVKEQTIAPPAVDAKTVEVAEGSTESPSAEVSDAAPEISLNPESGEPVDQPAGIGFPEDEKAPAAVQKKPRRRVKVQEPQEESAAALPASEEKPAAPKRARARKAAVAVEAPVVMESQPAETKADTEIEPVVKMDAAEDKPQALEAVATTVAAQIAQAAPPARKTRKRRTEILAGADTVSVAETSIAVDPVIPEAPQANPQSPAPVRPRKTRARKDGGASAALATPEGQSPANAAGGDPVEGLQLPALPEVSEPLAISEQQFPQDAPVGLAEDPLRVRKPRRPRAVKQAPENPTEE